MSFRLGPIHHWIFQQVGLVETRGETIARALADQFGEEASQRWDEIRSEHPGAFGGQELESLVDGDIHGSLDGMIAVVQSREAALYRWALEQEDGRARELFRELYARDGASWGRKARAAVPQSDPARIFGALRELWLEGMPCDVRLEVTDQSEDRVEWARAGLPLSRYWADSGVPAEEIFALHRRWMEAFVSAFGGGFKVEAHCAGEAGTGEYRFTIARR